MEKIDTALRNKPLTVIAALSDLRLRFKIAVRFGRCDNIEHDEAERSYRNRTGGRIAQRRLVCRFHWTGHIAFLKSW